MSMSPMSADVPKPAFENRGPDIGGHRRRCRELARTKFVPPKKFRNQYLAETMVHPALRGF
jgi:hypothetical protein